MSSNHDSMEDLACSCTGAHSGAIALQKQVWSWRVLLGVSMTPSKWGDDPLFWAGEPMFEKGHGDSRCLVQCSSRGRFPIIFNHRSFQRLAVFPGIPEVFWKEGSLERMRKVPLK